MSQSLVYTSQTGIPSAESSVVEHVVTAKVRMTDPGYGLKTGAKRTHDIVAKDNERAARVEFARQKAEAIARQHAREAEKRESAINQLTAEIARLHTSLLAGTSSDKAKVAHMLRVLENRKANLVRNANLASK